jgi:hypothetical protein
VADGDGVGVLLDIEGVGLFTAPAGGGSLLHAVAANSRTATPSDRSQRVPAVPCMRAEL